MKKLAFLIVISCWGLLIYGTADFPPYSDPESPAARHVSPYYIEKSIEQTAVPNIVTAVLADYRGYDTLLETTVIFSAGIACFALLRVFVRERAEVRFYRHVPTGVTLRIEKGGRIPDESSDFERIDTLWTPYDLITKTTCRLVIPFIQLFALYVIAHGHYSPGGGFQGGVILGASLILFAVSYDLRSTRERLSERAGALLATAGILIYAGTGALCILLGASFLDYSALAQWMGVGPVIARSHGMMIVEIGVGLTVMATMVWIYYLLSSLGRIDEGL